MTMFVDHIYPIVSVLAQVLMQAVFFSRFVEKRPKMVFVILFSVLGCIVIYLPMDTLLQALLLTGMLMIGGVFLLKAAWGTSALYALLTVVVMQLCFGLINAVTGVVSPRLYPENPAFFGALFMIAGTLISLGLAYLCYVLISRFFGCQEAEQARSVLMIWTPLFLIFLVSEYIGNTVYGNTVTLDVTGRLLGADHMWMLGVQTLGIVSVFCMMAAYRRLMSSFSLRMRYAALEQQSSFQRQYVEEAETRYDGVRSLRHDMKNHILVLKGLLDKAETDKAKAYIADMDVSVTDVDFPFQTGNPTADILLQNKAALAAGNGISMESTLRIPSPCTVKDVDLCIILSNALDNAIHAVQKLPNNRQICISSKQQGDILLIEVQNGFDGNTQFKRGVGLNNIKWAAEKYGGTMDVSIENNLFRLSVLLVISQQPENIS